MKKSILAFIILPYFISAQIGINTITPTKSLDNNGELRVRTLPQGATNDDILSADTNGNLRKISRNDLSTASSGFNNTILGYDPKPVATRPQPPEQYREEEQQQNWDVKNGL